jgi:hypothetical protein
VTVTVETAARAEGRRMRRGGRERRYMVVIEGLAGGV